MATRARFYDMVPPRLLNERETAHYIGMSASQFSGIWQKLETTGFPAKHPMLHKRDRRAIDIWLDQQFLIGASGDMLDALLEHRLGELGYG